MGFQVSLSWPGARADSRTAPDFRSDSKELADFIFRLIEPRGRIALRELGLEAILTAVAPDDAPDERVRWVTTSELSEAAGKLRRMIVAGGRDFRRMKAFYRGYGDDAGAQRESFEGDIEDLEQMTIWAMENDIARLALRIDNGFTWNHDDDGGDDGDDDDDGARADGTEQGRRIADRPHVDANGPGAEVFAPVVEPWSRVLWQGLIAGAVLSVAIWLFKERSAAALLGLPAGPLGLAIPRLFPYQTLTLDDARVTCRWGARQWQLAYTDIAKIIKMSDYWSFETHAPRRRCTFRLHGHEDNLPRITRLLDERARTMNLGWITNVHRALQIFRLFR